MERRERNLVLILVVISLWGMVAKCGEGGEDVRRRHGGDGLVAMVQTRNGESDQVALLVVGSSEGPTALTNLPGGTVTSPRLSPSGERVLFTWEKVAGHGLLHIVGTCGDAAPVRATALDGDRYVELSGDWLYDESAIVLDYVDRARDGDEAVVRIGIYDMESAKLHELVPSPPGSSNFFPRWSPDGAQILFLSDRAGYHPDFHLYDFQAGEAKPLPHLPPLVHFPAGNRPSYDPASPRSFVYQEDREIHGVTLVRIDPAPFESEEKDGVEWLFSTRSQYEGAVPVDLLLSQCVPSPRGDGRFCCKHIDEHGTHALALVDSQGSVMEDLTPRSQTSTFHSPHWQL